MNFHDVRFPTAISRGATGGPERRTEIVVLGSGHEERNARWADARRNYNAGYGVRSVDDLHTIIAFFEERRGQLYGFRWKDHTDFKSVSPGVPVSFSDQLIGVGDGANDSFQLSKTYGASFSPYRRDITKPVQSTVRIAVDGVEQVLDSDVSVDVTTGVVTFAATSIPASGETITAGFEFDTPVRFAIDRLDINLACVTHGSIPTIPVTEIRV